ncbi:Lactose transport system permease protein LacF [Streptomyces sp. RB5]|uniref:Lactose transport system permease protein LacF n=1 Tax=Streptomyces smaragdinus TaxID=2585196 RepID=A0A7K0CTL3_9ACTN|nr:sugar ABC transporter permease [Streptomyces smaragdinus]MQY16826.1 Lactose transport system permease protein LacF [Streptomyces smaragdinus]
MKEKITTPEAASRRSTPAARGGRPRRRKLTVDRVTFFLAFLGVPLAVFVTFVLYPFVQAIFWAMTNWRGFSPEYDFVGLDNFTKMFEDDVFQKALRNVALLAAVVPFVTLSLSLAVAVAVTLGGPSRGAVRGIGGASFYRIVSFFPYVVPAIIVGLIWAQMFDPNAGLVNGFLTKIGLDQFEAFAWLGEKSAAMPSLMFVFVWGLVGFYAVLFIAAIKGVPAELYEAARIDGAGRFRTTISVTLPAIRDSVQTAYIYLGIAALDAFVFVQALLPNGGPDNSTLTISQRLFNVAFRQQQFGYATAMGVVLAVVTLVFAALVFLVNRLTGGGESDGMEKARGLKSRRARAEGAAQ